MPMFEFNDETEWILGRPNFWCSGIARILREKGQAIPKKAEAEQAAVIYWMLELYDKHGSNWKEAGEELLTNKETNDAGD